MEDLWHMLCALHFTHAGIHGCYSQVSWKTYNMCYVLFILHMQESMDAIARCHGRLTTCVACSSGILQPQNTGSYSQESRNPFNIIMCCTFFIVLMWEYST